MHCTKCGNVIQEGAKFCAQCGNKIVVDDSTAMDKCIIDCTEMEFKWALFGKYTYKFQARRLDGSIVLESDKMTLSGFEYNGPKEGAKRYQKIFDKFVDKLEADGWQKGKERPDPWYSLTFYK